MGLELLYITNSLFSTELSKLISIAFSVAETAIFVILFGILLIFDNVKVFSCALMFIMESIIIETRSSIFFITLKLSVKSIYFNRV